LLFACLVKIRRMVLSSRNYDANCSKGLLIFSHGMLFAEINNMKPD
jgi:hypothetical protein